MKEQLRQALAEFNLQREVALRTAARAEADGYTPEVVLEEAKAAVLKNVIQRLSEILKLGESDVQRHRRIKLAPGEDAEVVRGVYARTGISVEIIDA